MTAPVFMMTLLVLFVITATAAAGMRSGASLPPRTIRMDRVYVEVHDAHVVEDGLVDAVWRAAISTTNPTRRPRPVPNFAERATVSAGHRVYLAEVYLDDDCAELNPRAVALAWVEFVLPAGTRPRSLTLAHLRGAKRPASRRFHGLAPMSVANC